ncbi:MAG: acetoin:2,6-dichlorophenolindophenol oxidoreductase subunit beta [Gaiellales bacterium]|nr:acetoin:2,6-dichlorophenolindophenol oxidoreductase subunit beta [Gaiellales bacterium]
MSTISDPTAVEFRAAVRDALDEELARDENVLLFGEDIAVAGGVFVTTPGLAEKYGDERVFDTPISELALIGAAYGSAVCGKRPVIEIMFGDFLPLVMDGVINQATKYWYLSNEQGSVPLVVLSVIGAGGRFGAIHSQTPIGWFHSVPGLKIACPSTPSDAKSLLKQAIRDDNPVLFLEHKRLLGLKGEIDEDPLPFGKARVARAGSDLTIVSVMKGVHDSLAAAEELAGEGIDCEVIDLRTIKPLDIETVIASVERTTRLLVVEEGPLTGGWAGEVMARVTEQALGSLDDAWRLATADTPIPYSPPLEDAFLPGAGAIIQSVKERSA